MVNQKRVNEIINEIKPATLVAATKYASIEDLYELEKVGVTIFGENQVQSLLEKYKNYNGKSKFHMIGTLQTNKVKYIIDKVNLIHSVANYRLIDEIDKQSKKHNKNMDILIQVNIAKEDSKHGFLEEELDDVFEYLKNKSNLNPRGLMIMAPNIDPEKTDIYFKKAKELLNTLKNKFSNYNLTDLSMGMSNDYQYAIKNGATLVRVGSLLFE
ncbi:MAG: YggS family pyridoxal phosphate-dependent enzyme [Bacilli bacterium]|nr:YggS family pyridoxal phosphate-dependent enzyme [Bacilli bacterium]